MQSHLNPSDKSRTGALFMCLLLGFLGVHRFYVGKIGTGILWLLTGGFLGLGVLIDFLMIACGVFRDSEGRVLSEW